jgi:hypothetical protein
VTKPTRPLVFDEDFRSTDPASTVAGEVESEPATTSRTRPSTLSPSVLSDLKRFSGSTEASDLLPALAASLRHTQDLVLHLQHDLGNLLLCVFPRAQRFGCALNLLEQRDDEIARLQLSRVEPWDDFWHGGAAAMADTGAQAVFRPLRPLLWRLALHGARDELLPEIAGAVRYRLAPGVSLRHAPLDEHLRPILRGLRHVALSFDEFSDWSGVAPPTLRRLLNALYLQSGLILSRSILANTRDGMNDRRQRFNQRLGGS